MFRLFSSKIMVALAVLLVLSALTSAVALADPETDPAAGTLVDDGPITDSAAIESAANVNGFTYVDEGSSIEITGYIGAGGAVTMPETINGKDVTSISDAAFKGNSKLTGVVISSKITLIPQEAFAQCTKLASVTLPEGLQHIDFEAFCNSGLTHISIPKNVIGLNWSFIQCKSLAAIDVSADNATFTSEDGVVYSKDKTWLVCCPAGKSGVFTVPEGVEALDSCSFHSCYRLTKIVLPASLEKVSDWAFCNCYGMKSIEIPSNVTLWGTQVFMACTKLTGAYFYGAQPAFSTKESPEAYVGPGVPSTFKVYYTVGQADSWSGYTETAKQPFCAVTVNPKNGAAAYTELHGITDGHIAAPATPMWADHAFLGWYKESACTTPWDFATETITANISVFAKWAYLPAPASVAATVHDYNSVDIVWGSTADAAGYEVWRAKSSSGKYSLIGTALEASFADTALTSGKTYYYKVRSYCQVGSDRRYSAWSAKVSVTPLPAAPTLMDATPTTYNSITVTWAAVNGATKYAVYRATSLDGKYKLVGKTASTSYTNKNVTTGTTYYYKVRAYHSSACGAYSDADSAKTVLAPPAPTAASASVSSILVSWDAVPGATQYEVWACTTSGGTYTLMATTAAKSYLHKNLVPGDYYYKVRAVRGSVYSDFCAPVYAHPEITK